jgi:hypothetical protein
MAALVNDAAELRRQLAGRLPHSVPWRFHEFVLGTVNMSWPERGVYMGLLWHQFDKGSLPTGAELARVVGMEPAAFEPLWQNKLAEKFSEHAGRLYNVTMLREWNTQAQYLLRERARSRRS